EQKGPTVVLALPKNNNNNMRIPRSPGCGSLRTVKAGRLSKLKPHRAPKLEIGAVADSSVPELESLGDRLVPGSVGGVEIIQQAATLTHHHQQATTGAVVLGVLLQVFREFVDAFSEQGNLHVR